jgi:hypothetical protein
MRGHFIYSTCTEMWWRASGGHLNSGNSCSCSFEAFYYWKHLKRDSYNPVPVDSKHCIGKDAYDHVTKHQPRTQFLIV